MAVVAQQLMLDRIATTRPDLPVVRAIFYGWQKPKLKDGPPFSGSC